ncbi:hypothetical protein E4U39_006578 [Claviceps sp. Clav50 group G5]|nr:hypothetical protein E4U39_006578 [Claviceps sp. Clav50 group G5]
MEDARAYYTELPALYLGRPNPETSELCSERLSPCKAFTISKGWLQATAQFH